MTAENTVISRRTSVELGLLILITIFMVSVIFYAGISWEILTSNTKRIDSLNSTIISMQTATYTQQNALYEQNAETNVRLTKIETGLADLKQTSRAALK